MKQLGNTLEIDRPEQARDRQAVPAARHHRKTRSSLHPALPACTAMRSMPHASSSTSRKATDVAIGEATSFTWDGARYDLQLTGAHQIKNAALAIETDRACSEKLKHSPSPGA
ncbi:MAG: hypothetical protein MZU97_11170 [Bacillus subtilis]|nr:hypothetical protein [Bacillus subtilis]